MCSIFGVLQIRQDLKSVRKMALRQSRLMRHRGPDWSGVYTAANAVLAHERLAIVDVNTGAQPILSESGRQALAVNGDCEVSIFRKKWSDPGSGKNSLHNHQV